MRYKNDIVMAATSARSYNRHWRAHKLTWSEIGKIKYLFDGAYEYMDEVTLAYTRMHFNKLRKALGFKQDSELSELVEKAGAFRIVRNRETNQLEAFISPLVGDRFTPTETQVIEEPSIPYEIFDCKANAFANDNDRDNISENQRQHKNGIDMHVLLAGNVPKFHVEASEGAKNRIIEIIGNILENRGLYNIYFGECIYHYCHKYRVSKTEADDALDYYLRRKLIGHMSRRVGIENWPIDAILEWLGFYFGAKRLPQVITEVHEEWMKCL